MSTVSGRNQEPNHPVSPAHSALTDSDCDRVAEEPTTLGLIQSRLLDWYAVNRRALPWRGDTDPYRVLVSEVMLQQTGVERVKDYYRRFLDQFPDFASLAAAPRVDVLKVWGGLGYNRRAVYLHDCARAVVERHDGQLPADPVALARLPGVGPYTLAAVLCFAFGQDVATVDTNIQRVLGRAVFGGEATRDQIHRVASTLLPVGRAAAWNQALMDFGSLQCTARNPKCLFCPLNECCAAVAQPQVSQTRRVAELREPFVGSRRYLRGRIVARLRDLAPLATVPLESFANLLPTPVDRIRLIEIARGLAEHNLARLVEDENGLCIGPPS